MLPLKNAAHGGAARIFRIRYGEASVNAGKLWLAARLNQIGALSNQFAWPPEGLPPDEGLAGIPIEGGLGEEGADVKFSKAV